MEIADRQIDGVVVIDLQGSIDTITAPTVAEYIDRLLADGTCNLAVDFTGVDYTSSAGLRVLLGAVKKARGSGGDLRLAGIQRNVLKVLQLSGFTDILKTYDELSEAVGSFA